MITKIANANGIEMVRGLLKEELAELLAATFRYTHREDNIDNLAEEMADVKIMIKQYFYLKGWLFQKANYECLFEELPISIMNAIKYIEYRGEYEFLSELMDFIEHREIMLGIRDKVDEYDKVKIKRTAGRVLGMSCLKCKHYEVMDSRWYICNKEAKDLEDVPRHEHEYYKECCELTEVE